jgi:hypothetical protein
MPRVELREVVGSADRAAVMVLRRAPGQDRYLGSMADIFAEADAERRARRHPRRTHGRFTTPTPGRSSGS